MPPVEPSSSEDLKAAPADTIIPIHVDDAQYLQLTRALCPKPAAVPKDLELDLPGLDAPEVVGGTSLPPPTIPRTDSPEQPPGTPIV